MACDDERMEDFYKRVYPEYNMKCSYSGCSKIINQRFEQRYHTRGGKPSTCCPEHSRLHRDEMMARKRERAEQRRKASTCPAGKRKQPGKLF